MLLACHWGVVVQLTAAAIALVASLALVLSSRRFRRAAEEQRAATQNAVLLTTRVVSHCAPYLECEVCGSRLDTMAGVGIGIDGAGQLRLRCADHQDQEL